jgi:hypothetical protein
MTNFCKGSDDTTNFINKILPEIPEDVIIFKYRLHPDEGDIVTILDINTNENGCNRSKLYYKIMNNSF